MVYFKCMPGRAIPLVTDEIYHVFNRGIDRRTTFLNRWEYARAKQTVSFYRFIRPPIKLSQFLRLGSEKRQTLLKKIEQSPLLVDILAYCLMPNHFHIVLRQRVDGGVSKYLSNLQNSYTRYFNTKEQRTGPLFLDQFKAVRVETDEQLHHLIRYVHLNPYTAYVVKNFGSLENYSWSSFMEYIGKEVGICDQEITLAAFHTRKKYKQFVFDQANYQRELSGISHLILEENP